MSKDQITKELAATISGKASYGEQFLEQVSEPLKQAIELDFGYKMEHIAMSFKLLLKFRRQKPGELSPSFILSNIKCQASDYLLAALR